MENHVPISLHPNPTISRRYLTLCDAGLGQTLALGPAGRSRVIEFDLTIKLDPPFPHPHVTSWSVGSGGRLDVLGNEPVMKRRQLSAFPWSRLVEGARKSSRSNYGSHERIPGYGVQMIRDHPDEMPDRTAIWFDTQLFDRSVGPIVSNRRFLSIRAGTR